MMPEGERRGGGQVVIDGDNLPYLVGIGLSDVLNIGEAKGQLISKCPYEKSVWTKYQRKYF